MAELFIPCCIALVFAVLYVDLRYRTERLEKGVRRVVDELEAPGKKYREQVLATLKSLIE